MFHIAVCDDSPADIEKLERIFDEMKDYQFDYDIFLSAKDLLASNSTSDTSYQLYILDIEMADMDGINLANNPQNRCKGTYCFLNKPQPVYD